ncbi:MAG: flagellar motor protein PomA [Magnetococcales bacterium]|nr:MotA/TolQ/ExbB proton channel family protein [Magnetococcales bacterium]NGZ26958.1 flagellar motor protein PomA [Magnetococcales bacterium]
MDFATVIGLTISISLNVWAILMGGSFLLFVDAPSVAIVFGGTIGSLFTKHPMKEVFSTVGVVSNAFVVKIPNPQDMIGQIIDMANIARKDGILALEKVKSNDTFLQSAINHCVDGADPEFLESVLNKELEYLSERHSAGIAILESIGDSAPAYGMLGTLIGLVQMLASMDDPAAIGPAMAVAILTTLYGAFVANVIALPLANKLGIYNREEQLVRRIVIDGMIGIQKGVNPRMLQESLKTALPPRLRDTIRS